MNKMGITMDNEFDFSTAKKPHEVPALQQLQQAHRRSMQQSTSQLFDDDVVDWVSKQDNKTRQAVNTMIRQMMIVQTA